MSGGVSSVAKRIQKEVREMAQQPPSNCSAGPITEQDIYSWQATIIGPADSPYQGGIFNLKIVLSNNYPEVPPKCKTEC